STLLVSSANASVAGQSVTFTATVTVSAPGSTAVANPSGLVTFSDGATSLGQGTLSTVGGISTASFSTSSLTVGSHPLTASFAGNSNFLSSSGTLTQTVSKAGTSSLVGSSANPAASGQVVTFTVTVTVNAPGSTA